MAKGMGIGLAWALIGLGLASTMATGQVVERERDTKLTGPRGRTIERDITVKRGPGFVDRQVEIKRPGETIIRDTRVQTGPAGRPFGAPFGRPPFPGPGPRFFGGPRFVENVVVQQPPPVAAFIGLPALSFSFGGGGGGGGGGYAGPPPSAVAAPQPPPQFDAFADAIGRLKSFHGSSRRDGCLTLGRIGDPRAVPALNERLEHDFDKDVRVAAAWALGEIGDERGAVALERAVLSEKHHKEVRDAATEALKKLPKPGEVRAARPTPGQSSQPAPRPAAAPSQPSTLDPGPPASSPGQVYPEDQPPPPPVPASIPQNQTAPAPQPTLEPPSNSGPFRNPS